MNQLDLFGDAGNDYSGRHYILGRTKEAGELWNTTGYDNIPAITELLGWDGADHIRAKVALNLSAAMICLDVLAQDISKARLRLKRKISGKTEGEEEVKAKEHKLARLLALRPNADWHTWVEFTQMMIYHLGLASNSYAYIRRSNAGDVIELVPLQPGQVQEQINSKERKLFYDISASTEYELAQLGFAFKRVPADDVIHIRQRVLDGFWGYSTLKAGASTLAAAKIVESYERDLFKENGLFRGYFQRNANKPISGQEQFDRIRAQITKAMNPRKKGETPPLFEDGIEYKQMGMTAKETELSKALDVEVERICRLWRIPPHKAMHLGAVKYENLATLEMIYVRDTLIPICELIEQRLDHTLLTEEEILDGYFFEFDRDAMSIVDQKIENERLKQLVERGVISINEMRAEMGYNPRKGGDLFLMPINSFLFDANGKIVVIGAKIGDKNAEGKEPDEPGEETAEDTEDKGLTLPGVRLISSR